MATTHFLLAFFCLAVTGSHGQPNSHRLTLVTLAQKEIGVREEHGNNTGIKVNAYLAITGVANGNPWCAAFVSWVYFKAGFLKPRSAWSPDLFPSSRLTTEALPGNVLGIYFPALHRIAHVGLIIRKDGDWVVSTEGNTNVSGSREGDGVYLKRRHRRTIYRIADWVKEGRRIP